MPDLGFTAQQGAPESLMVSIVEDDPRIRQLIEEEVIDEGHPRITSEQQRNS